MGTGDIGVRLRLPDWQCDQCILQWTYTAGKAFGAHLTHHLKQPGKISIITSNHVVGNSWGVGQDGVGGLGLGPQEHFR